MLTKMLILHFRKTIQLQENRLAMCIITFCQAITMLFSVIAYSINNMKTFLFGIMQIL